MNNRDQIVEIIKVVTPNAHQIIIKDSYFLLKKSGESYFLVTH